MDDVTLDIPPPDATPDNMLAQAQQRLVAGKRATAAGDFSTADVELQQAQTIFDSAQVSAEDQAARQLRDQIAAAAQIVALAQRAESERAQGQHERALATLDEAKQQLKPDDADIAAAIGTLRLRVAGERKRIDDEEQQIVKGDRLLAQHSLDKAAERYRAACNALLPDTRQRAEEGLQKAQEAIQAFEEDVRQARQTTAAPAAAEAWQRAYDRWPTERSAVAGLTDALARAGQAALAEGDIELARSFFERALRLKPKDAKAGSGMQQLARAEQIKLSIIRTRDEIDKLTQRGVPKDGDDIELRKQLTQLSSEADDLTALQREIAELLEDLDQRQEHGRAIAVADEQAAQLAAAGDWDAAIQAHLAALAALGDPLPALAVRRHTTWHDAQATSASTAREGAQLLDSAQAAYEASRSAGDFADVIAKCTTIDQLIEAAVRRIQIVGVARPSELQALSNRAEVLRRRAEAAELALDAVTVQQGLSGIHEALRALGDDATLRRIETDLANQRNQQVPTLLFQAEQAEEQDAIGDALDYLRQAREIDPNNPGLAERLDQISRRRRFEEALRRAETDAEVAGSSLTAKRNALRRALETFLMPEFAVPDTTRATIRALISLGDENSGEAFADDKNWRQARDLRDQLLSHEGWVDRHAAQFTEQWMEAAREAALRGAITSLAQLGDVLSAYRTAFNYRRVYQSEEAIYYLERAQDGLRQSLNGQADTLLTRATDALASGQYATALDNLERLEDKYYKPIEGEFPYLLDTLDEYGEITQSRRDAKALRQQAEQLQQQVESIKQALDAVERAFIANQFVEAEQALQTITHHEKLTSLKQRADTLSVQIGRSRKQQARSQLGEQFARARTALRTETDNQQLSQLLAELEQFGLRFDWEALTEAEHGEFETMKAQVAEACNTLNTIESWEKNAQHAREADDYERAARALDNAIKATEVASAIQLGGRRAQLQAEFKEVEILSQRQRSRNDAINDGRLRLGKRDYAGANEAFALAQSFGANVDLLQRASRAGELLQQARAAWEAKSGLVAARDEIDLAVRLAKDNLEAASLAYELDHLSNRIQQRIEAIENTLGRARMAMTQNDLSAADEHIRIILDWDTTHGDALKLQREHQDRAKNRVDNEQFHIFLERANDQRKQGNTNTALTFIEQALELRPNDVVATNLQADLKREHEANEVLLQARTHIYDGKFSRATELIRVAELHASPVLLEEVRRLLEELEAAYRANTVYPIRNLLRDERYREALRRCTDTLKYVESEQLRDELTDLVSTVVKRWADKSITLAQSRLRTAVKEEDFSDAAADLRVLGRELSDYPESAQIEHQIRQANIGRLNMRLDTIETILQQRALLHRAGSTDPVEASVAGIAVAGPHTLTQLRNLANTTLPEAEAMQIDQLSARTRTLLETIDERTLLEQARDAQVLLDRATARPTIEQADQDLQQAHALLESVLKHDRFRNDKVSIELLDLVDKAHRALQQTRDGLVRAEQSLASGRFADAQRSLRRISAVYPLLRPRYDQLIALLDLLGRAEGLADKHEWREAFALYREAARLEPALDLISRKIERCQEQITEQLRQESRIALQALPPEPDVARALLSEAEKAGWLDPSASGEIASLRKWIASRKRAVEAIALLDPARAEPERALDALREALRTYSDPESDDQIAQWMLLAQALLDWQTGHLSAAYRSLEHIDQSVAAMPYTRAARRLIRGQLLGDLRGQAEHALQTWNPELAAQSITSGLRIAADDAELRELSLRQQQIVQHAPDLRKHMEAGWRVLERTSSTRITEDDWDYLREALDAFEQALQIDEQFAEAAHWQLFTQSVERALRTAEQRETGGAKLSFEALGQIFENAGQSFDAAAHALSDHAGDPRPAILGGAKRQDDQRRQAADATAQLASAAHKLAQLYYDVQTYVQQEDVEKVYPTLVEIDQQQDRFKRLSHRPLLQSSNAPARRKALAALESPANGSVSIVPAASASEPLYWSKRRDLQAKIKQMDAALTAGRAALLDGQIPAARPSYLEAQNAERAAQQLADETNMPGPAGQVAASFGRAIHEKLDAIVGGDLVDAALIHMQFQNIAELEHDLTGGASSEALALLPRTLFEKSMQAANANKFDQAKKYLDQITELDPANAHAKTRLADLLLKRAKSARSAGDGEAALVFVGQARAAYDQVRAMPEFATRRADFERELAEEQDQAYFAAGKQARDQGHLFRARQYFQLVPITSIYRSQAREAATANIYQISIRVAIIIIVLIILLYITILYAS